MEDNAKKIYLKWYNSALHYHTWVWIHTYVRRCFVIPTRCLEHQMTADIALIMEKRVEMVDKDGVVPDWGMNYYGMEIEE